MRLAVSTNKYLARVATFCERDRRALIDAGVTLDVFAIHPLDETTWPLDRAAPARAGVALSPLSP